jgi:hypothetical protein
LVGKLGFGRGAASRSTASRGAVREEDIGCRGNLETVAMGWLIDGARRW